MKIFVTTGTQEPFNRLIKTIDEWAETAKNVDIFAQIGNTRYIPKNIEWKNFLDSFQYNNYFKNSDIIISHAGMGTIINALTQQKQILVMPRLKSFKEHRNDHQLSTCEQFEKLDYINIAHNENSLKEYLNNLNSIKLKHNINDSASPELISAIDNYIKHI